MYGHSVFDWYPRWTLGAASSQPHSRRCKQNTLTKFDCIWSWWYWYFGRFLLGTEGVTVVLSAASYLGHNAVLRVQKMTYKLKQLLMSILKGLFRFGLESLAGASTAWTWSEYSCAATSCWTIQYFNVENLLAHAIQKVAETPVQLPLESDEWACILTLNMILWRCWYLSVNQSSKFRSWFMIGLLVNWMRQWMMLAMLFRSRCSQLQCPEGRTRFGRRSGKLSCGGHLWNGIQSPETGQMRGDASVSC